MLRKRGRAIRQRCVATQAQNKTTCKVTSATRGSHAKQMRHAISDHEWTTCATMMCQTQPCSRMIHVCPTDGSASTYPETDMNVGEQPEEKMCDSPSVPLSSFVVCVGFVCLSLRGRAFEAERTRVCLLPCNTSVDNCVAFIPRTKQVSQYEQQRHLQHFDKK